MATKKTEVVTGETTVINTEKKEEMITFVVPPRFRGDTEPLFVSVNERTFLVKVGEPVEMPMCVYKVIMNSIEMSNEGLAFETEAQNMSKQPH